MRPADVRLAFLVYVSRSGSTLLADRLNNRICNLYVLPEFRALTWACHIAKRSRRCAIEDARILEFDPQFSNLPDSLQVELRARLCARNTEEVLVGILEAIRQWATTKARIESDGSYAPTVLVQGGGLLWHKDLLAKCCPNSVWLHIVRDPRGVVNSQRRAVRPYGIGHETMLGGNPLRGARYWQEFVSCASDEWDVYTVRYEDFVMSPELTLKGVAQCLGCRLTPIHEFGRPRGHLSIGRREREIHELVREPIDSRRMHAWRHELSRRARLIVESEAIAGMERWGYGPTEIGVSAPHRGLLPVLRICYQLRGVVNTVWYGVFRRDFYRSIRLLVWSLCEAESWVSRGWWVAFLARCPWEE